MKQVIVMRKDLAMRAGKMVAQGAHATGYVVNRHSDDPRVRDWIQDAATKVCVRIESETDLTAIIDQARNAGIIVEQVVDSGRTEFNGVATLTCCAIGPDTNERIDAITGHLPLL